MQMPTTPEEQARRVKAAAEFAERTHAAYHQLKGAKAPCERCN